MSKAKRKPRTKPVDADTTYQYRRHYPELLRPLDRTEAEELADLIEATYRRNGRASSIHGCKSGVAWQLASRRLIVPTAVNRDMTVEVSVTAFGRLVAHALEAVALCHAHPLDHEPPSLFHIDCPECNGTGADDPDCWLCEGYMSVKTRKAVKAGFDKEDLDDEGDGYCRCPACGGDSCEACSGDGRQPADYMRREMARVLLTASEHIGCSDLFPDIRWTGGGPDWYFGGIIDVDSRLSRTAHGKLYELRMSWGLSSSVFSDHVHISDDGERAVQEFLARTETADLIRMWQAGNPWSPRQESGEYRNTPTGREHFEEAAAFWRCRARGWIRPDYVSSGYIWTEEGRAAVAGWDGSEIVPDRPRLQRVTNELGCMEALSRDLRAAHRAEDDFLRARDDLAEACLHLEEAELAGRPTETLQRAVESCRRDRNWTAEWLRRTQRTFERSERLWRPKMEGARHADPA